MFDGTEVDVKFEGNWLVTDWHKEFDEIWPEHSKTPNIYTLIGCFWRKYVMLELKKV